MEKTRVDIEGIRELVDFINESSWSDVTSLEDVNSRISRAYDSVVPEVVPAGTVVNTIHILQPAKP